MGADFDRVVFTPDTVAMRKIAGWDRYMPALVAAQTLGVAVHLLTERWAKAIVKRLIRDKGINLVHQVGPVSPRIPSLLYGLKVPVVFGPMSGDMDYPPAFRYLHGGVSRVVEKAGRQFSRALNRVFPGKLQADCLLVANAQTRAALPGGDRANVVDLVEIGIDADEWLEFGRTGPDTAGRAGVRFAFVGRLIPLKGVDLLLEAFARVIKANPDARLQIIGSGETEASLRELARTLDIAEAVEFTGWLSPAEVARALAASHVFVLPSLRECGGIVMLEAMALGLPVVATRWGGPGTYLDDDVAMLVEPDSRHGFVQGLAEAMSKLAQSPELRQRMGEAGVRKVRETSLNWHRKVDRILEIYRQTVDRFSATTSART